MVGFKFGLDCSKGGPDLVEKFTIRQTSSLMHKTPILHNKTCSYYVLPWPQGDNSKWETIQHLLEPAVKEMEMHSYYNCPWTFLVHFKLLSHVKSVPQRTGGVEIGLAPIQTVLDASISIFMFLTPSSCPLDHFGLFQVATLPKMSAPTQWWCSFSTIMHTGGPIERPLPCLLKFFAYSNSPLTKMDTFKAHLYVI